MVRFVWSRVINIFHFLSVSRNFNRYTIAKLGIKWYKHIHSTHVSAIWYFKKSSNVFFRLELTFEILCKVIVHTVAFDFILSANSQNLPNITRSLEKHAFGFNDFIRDLAVEMDWLQARLLSEFNIQKKNFFFAFEAT